MPADAKGPFAAGPAVEDGVLGGAAVDPDGCLGPLHRFAAFVHHADAGRVDHLDRQIDRKARQKRDAGRHQAAAAAAAGAVVAEIDGFPREDERLAGPAACRKRREGEEGEEEGEAFHCGRGRGQC